jgi:hypothetical protein
MKRPRRGPRNGKAVHRLVGTYARTRASIGKKRLVDIDRFATAEEIGDFVAVLVSEKQGGMGWMAGSDVVIDGGEYNGSAMDLSTADPMRLHVVLSSPSTLHGVRRRLGYTCMHHILLVYYSRLG